MGRGWSWLLTLGHSLYNALPLTEMNIAHTAECGKEEKEKEVKVLLAPRILGRYGALRIQ